MSCAFHLASDAVDSLDGYFQNATLLSKKLADPCCPTETCCSFLLLFWIIFISPIFIFIVCLFPNSIHYLNNRKRSSKKDCHVFSLILKISIKMLGYPTSFRFF